VVLGLQAPPAGTTPVEARWTAPSGPLPVSCGRWVPAALPAAPPFPWHWAAPAGDWAPTGPGTAPPPAPDWAGGAVPAADNLWFTHPLLRHARAGSWHDEVLTNVAGRITSVTVLPGGGIWAVGNDWGQGPPGGAGRALRAGWDPDCDPAGRDR